jgi:hypothetical protein
MKSPYCGAEMEKSFIQGGMAGFATSLLWTTRVNNY